MSAFNVIIIIIIVVLFVIFISIIVFTVIVSIAFMFFLLFLTWKFFVQYDYFLYIYICFLSSILYQSDRAQFFYVLKYIFQSYLEPYFYCICIIKNSNHVNK